MSPDFCEVSARLMLRLLDGYTYKIGCEHRDVAVVTTFINQHECYVTFMFQDQDVGFKVSDGQVVKLFQEDNSARGIATSSGDL